MRLATKKIELEEFIQELEERIDSEEEKTMKIANEKKRMEGQIGDLETTLVFFNSPYSLTPQCNSYCIMWCAYNKKVSYCHQDLTYYDVRSVCSWRIIYPLPNP